MKLELKHLAPYLPYGLKYYPSEKSDILFDAYSDNSPHSSWKYDLALQAGDEFALKLKNSYLIQNEPFFSFEDGELFLGQFTSSLGFDVDDVYLSEVKPILRQMSDLPDDIFNDFGFADEEDFLVCLREGKLNYCDIVKLISQHFDVFGLIDAGLAIDINTVPELLNG